MMELSQLKQFVAIAQYGSMSAAAKALFLSQSALSQSLKKLERELGVMLFDRSRNPLKPTEYGEIVLAHAERALFQTNAIVEQVAELKRANAKTVKVGCFYDIVAHSCMPIIARELPDCSFKVKVDDEEAVAKQLEHQLVDIGILSGNRPIAGFTAKTLIEEHLYVVVPVDAPLPHDYGNLPEIFKRLDTILPLGLRGITQWYEGVLAEMGVDDSRLTWLSPEEYFPCIENSAAAHFRSSLMVSPTNEAAHYRHIPIPIESAHRKITAYYAKDANGGHSALADYLDSVSEERFSSFSSLPWIVNVGNPQNLNIEI